MAGTKHKDKRPSKGSALILTVVLSSILAIVAVLFLLASRVETLSTSSLTDERDLNLAVDTIISKLSNILVLDTPGVSGQEYYDYPGEEDTWLASTEPYKDTSVIPVAYRWGQISDLTGYIRRNWGPADGVTQNVNVDPPGLREIIQEYSDVVLDGNGDLLETLADADGDGIADSKWFELEDDMGSRAQKIYAAVRVVDNAAMLNINTAYTPDENDIDRCDGRWLHQVNLEPLARLTDNADKVFSVRSNLGAASPTNAELEEYELRGAWKLADPCEEYTLFDISDELELRHRFCINSKSIARIENTWIDTVGKDFIGIKNNGPYAGGNFGKLTEWQSRTTNPADPNYDRRHILSVYNVDRIIAADAADANTIRDVGMVNVNFDPCDLDRQSKDHTELFSWNTARNFYARSVKCIEPNLPRATRRRMKRELAQLAVNLVDLRDIDSDVTSLSLPAIDNTNDFNDVAIRDEERFVYGFEPYPVITKIAIRVDPNDPCTNPNYYGVELYNPFNVNIDNRDSSFYLLVTDYGSVYDPCDPNASSGYISLPADILQPGEFMVVQNDIFFVPDPNVDPNLLIINPELRLSSGYVVAYDTNGNPIFVDPNIVDSHNIRVVRSVRARTDDSGTSPRDIFVDRQLIYQDWVGWDPNVPERYFGRNFDIDASRLRGAWWDVVFPTMEPISGVTFLGRVDSTNPYLDPGPAIDVSLPYGPDQSLRTIGDIARVWTVGPTSGLFDPCDTEAPLLFDPNQLDVGPIDPCNPADINDPNNTRFSRFNDYARTVGEKLLYVSRAQTPPLEIEEDEDFIRLNLADPLYTNLFQYITVFDPRFDGIDNDGDGFGIGRQVDYDELKVPGRINVNTAPYFVIQQLPWMTNDIARAIVDYRDKRGIYDANNTRYDLLKSELRRQLAYNVWRNYVREDRGFASIGELNLVAEDGSPDSIWEYGIDNFAETGFPDLTRNLDLTADVDDFEERDAIFARISNLVTVRSDVFTAYILVRLGRNGPQKRVVAILDRSNVYSSGGKVKVLAVHDVSYPR